MKRFVSSLLTCFWISLALLTAGAGKVTAQPIPVGSIQEQQYRLLQLLSDSTIQTSMNGRPIWNRTYQKIFKQPKIQQYRNSWWDQPLKGYEKKLSKHWSFGVYAPIITNTFNSALPYGGNNGSAWYGRGFNEEFQGGFYLTSRYVTATFRPHISYSQNTSFPVPRFIRRHKDGSPEYTSIINYFGTSIDMPFRFGPKAFTNFNLGLTSISVHYKSIVAGVSNQERWWGPGVQNALMLSDNAAGLKQAFLGTREPLVLPLGIGKLEFKFIWAEPRDSKYFKTTKRTDHQRFGAGLNVNYSPGFAPNLSLGITRFSWRYIPSGGLPASAFGADLPFFNHIQRKNREKNGRDVQNQMVSAYIRWVFPKGDADVYGEFYREDSYYNLRDLFLEPDHDRSFTIGFEKLVESNGWFNLFRFNGELNNLVPDRTSQVRRQAWPYTHGIIKQGHTNQGQVLGASIGPGSSSQYIGAEGFFEKGSIGLFIQRIAVNDFFHFTYYNTNKIAPRGRGGAKDPWRHRINLNIGVTGRYKAGPVLLSGKIIWDKNYNYGRYHYGELKGINFQTVDKHDIVNMQIQLSAKFLF
jgi:hypothetical protein